MSGMSAGSLEHGQEDSWASSGGQSRVLVDFLTIKCAQKNRNAQRQSARAALRFAGLAKGPPAKPAARVLGRKRPRRASNEGGLMA